MTRHLGFFIAVTLIGCSSGDITEEPGSVAGSSSSTAPGGGGSGGASGGSGGAGGVAGDAELCGNGIVEPGEVCDDGEVDICPSDCKCSFTYNGHCYIHSDERVPWITAYALCDDLGMHLASLTTMNEFNYVVGTVTNQFEEGDTWYYWIGANDRLVEGTFEWANGEEWTLENNSMWQPGEPENSESSDCVMIGANSKLFVTAPCTLWERAFVCEGEVTPE